MNYSEWLPSWKDLIKNTLSNGLVWLFVLIFGFVQITDKIDEIHQNVVKMEGDVVIVRETQADISDKYMVKDEDGVGIKVGISSELKGNQASVFKHNDCAISMYNNIELSNPLANLKPKLTVLINEEVERDDSKADIFISKEAASFLGFDTKKGVLDAKFKRGKSE